jgi:hypothetical protein
MAVTSMSQSSVGNFGRRNTFTNTVVTYGWQELEVIGDYGYLIFTKSSDFVVANGTLSAEILCVGAGGGGGYNVGGGGGGGAIEGAGPGYYGSQTLPVGTYRVEVGAGGSGESINFSVGGDTIFTGASTITASGGGGGGGQSPGGRAGGPGGSGGGGTGTGSTTVGGTASGNSTNVGGGASNVSPWYGGGGGGGATAVGVAAVSNNPGEGGEGLALTTIDANLTAANFDSFTGMTVISSGGGGCNVRANAGTMAVGALGGTGGGQGAASGSSYGELNAATDATSFGSGGGGGNWTSLASGFGTDGYSGLVIVRYAL